MAHPPKSDDDSSSAARTSDVGEKKPRRSRASAARPRKDGAGKPDKPGRRAKAGHHETPASAQDDRGPAIRDESQRGNERERAAESGDGEGRQDAPSRPDFVGRADRTDQAASADRPDAPAVADRTVFEPRVPAPEGGVGDGQPPAQAAQPVPDQKGQPQPKPQGGGRGDWQGGQQGQYGGGDRGFWKHGKRKRGRHGNWQGGGGPGPREQLPQQPPPPSNTPVYGDLPNPTRFADLNALDALARELSSGQGEPLFLNEIYARNLADLTAFARELGVQFEGAPNRRQLITEIFKFATAGKRTLRDTGYIDQND
ncbi:MAG: hypothetical protein WD941_08915, partial [Opitutus sp.]